MVWRSRVYSKFKRAELDFIFGLSSFLKCTDKCSYVAFVAVLVLMFFYFNVRVFEPALDH